MKKYLLAMSMLFLTMVPLSAKAQELSNTSTTTQNITLNLIDTSQSSKVKLSGIGDVNFGTKSNKTTESIKSSNQQVCFYNEGPTFKLTISRISNPESTVGLKIISQNGDSIPIYMKIWVMYSNGLGNVIQGNSIIDGQPITNLSGDRDSENCNGTYNTTGFVEYALNNSAGQIRSGELTYTVPAGNYTATFQWAMAAE